MANLQSDIQRLVDNFVSQVTELARLAAMESIENALGRTRGRGAGISTVRLSRGRGAKRTADELAKLGDQFAAYVAKNPGQRIEQINKQLGTTTKDLQLPIRKMIADGILKVKGKKRSTQYFPGPKA